MRVPILPDVSVHFNYLPCNAQNQLRALQSLGHPCFSFFRPVTEAGRAQSRKDLFYAVHKRPALALNKGGCMNT